MKFVFSKHALDQIKLRQIKKEDILKAIEKPLETITTKEEKVFHHVIISEGKKYLLRIFVNHLKVPNLIKTVYRTSKISKYHEGKI